jgi:hypothetical protein
VGSRICPVGLADRGGAAGCEEAVVDRNAVARATRLVTARGGKACERTAGEIRRRPRLCPEKEIPRELSAAGWLIACRCHETLQRVQAQKPRIAGPARNPLRQASVSLVAGKNGVRNGMWVHPRGNAAGTAGEEQAP